MRLRDQFEKEMELSWLNDQGEPDIEYVEWLEKRSRNSKKSFIECTNDLYTLFDHPEYNSSTNILLILRKHFEMEEK